MRSVRGRDCQANEITRLGQIPHRGPTATALADAQRNEIHCPSAEIDPLARILAVLCTAMLRLPNGSTMASGVLDRPAPWWHPAGFGDEVACFALKTDAELLLIDPLLPADPAPIHELVDAEAGEHGIAVLVTIPYHA